MAELPDDVRCVARAAAAVAGGPAFAGIGPHDPAVLAALARRHRFGAPVFALLAAHVRDRDRTIADALAASARQKRIGALLLARHATALSRAFSDAGIRHLAVKGPALAQQVYGDPAARDAKDLDFLIDPAAFDDAAALVRGLGFADAAGADLPGGKNRTFAGHGVDVELHDRLVDVPALFPIDFATLWDARDTVKLGGATLPVPGAVHRLLHLCVHGSEHLWFRLRWLQDIVAIVLHDRPDIVARTLALAAELRMSAMVVAALALVTRVFGITVPAAPPPDRATMRLVRLAERALVLPAGVASNPPLGWLLRKLPAQFGLRRDWRYRRALLHHILLSPRSFDLSPWPRGLRWAYQPLRPVLLLRSRRRTRRD